MQLLFIMHDGLPLLPVTEEVDPVTDTFEDAVHIQFTAMPRTLKYTP